MSDNRQTNFDFYFYILAFGIGITIRFLAANSLPLNDFEANLALQAYNLTTGHQPIIGSQPGYVALTSAWFFIWGASSFWARFWPALAGSLLVLAPFFFRKQLGRFPAILLAFGLALDPGLVAAARQAGSPSMAVSWLILGLGLWYNRRPILAGISLGIFVLSGESLWAGIIGLVLALAFCRILGVNLFLFSPEGDKRESYSRVYLKATLAGIATTFLVGTVFLSYPLALGGIANSLQTYIKGWLTASNVSLYQVLGAPLAYELLAVGLGAWGAVRGWIRKDPLDCFLSLWAGSALLLVLAEPGRQVYDLTWMLVPLWGLASRELFRHLRLEDVLPTGAQAALMVVVLVFIILNLTGIAGNAVDSLQNRAIIIIGAMFLLLASSFLLLWGWNIGVVRQGAVWGAVVVLVFYMISMTVAAAGLWPRPTAELWQRGGTIAQADLVNQTLNELSEYNTGFHKNLDISVAGIQSPALEWMLRGYPQVHFDNQLQVGTKSAIVITTQQQEPALASSYRGEGFSWQRTTQWQFAQPADFMGWLFYHRANFQYERIILWARTDLFPGEAIPAVQGLP